MSALLRLGRELADTIGDFRFLGEEDASAGPTGIDDIIPAVIGKADDSFLLRAKQEFDRYVVGCNGLHQAAADRSGIDECLHMKRIPSLSTLVTIGKGEMISCDIQGHEVAQGLLEGILCRAVPVDIDQGDPLPGGEAVVMHVAEETAPIAAADLQDFPSPCEEKIRQAGILGQGETVLAA